MSGEKAISVEFGGNAMPLPRRINVLIVDSDSTCLVILSKMFRRFGYEVLTAKQAADAFFIVRERENELDLILAEAHLPDMDKYELLETVGETSKLPVIVMSADDNETGMLGALFKGAEFYLVKPITMNDIKNLWQFAFTKKTDKMVATKGVSSISSDDIDNQILPNKGKPSHPDAKRKELTEVDKKEEEDNDDSSVVKKTKLTWTSELHNKFLQAIRVLGIDGKEFLGAHPKKILQHMNVPGLKKENISSHLQKYRLSLKREQDAIGKKRNRDNGESHFALCNLSSIVNVQGGLYQFPEMQSMTPCHQPEFGSLEHKNDANCWMPMPSCGSLRFFNNGEPSFNDTSDCKYRQLVPATNQLDFAYPCSSADIGIAGDGKLVGFHGEEFCKSKMDSSNNVDSGLQIAMQLPLSLIQEEEAKEQQQLLFPPELSPNGQEEYEIYGAGGVEIENLFDMKKVPTQLFLDKNFDDLL